MSRHCKTVVVILSALLTAATIYGADKNLRFTRPSQTELAQRRELRLRAEARPPETRIVTHSDTIAWRVDGWVVGQELFKGYIDPSATCPDPFPFTVTEIGLPMYFAQPGVIFVSADIEDLIYGPGGCPFPDSPLAISIDYQVYIADAGYYDIWIPLDNPVTVYGPFFAGFFIGNPVDSSNGLSILLDDDTDAACRCYNIWDEQIGFIDPVANSATGFPGKLVMYAAGQPASARSPSPEPELTILSPRNDERIFGSTTIWAVETSGSGIIEHVSFECLWGDSLVEVGRDYGDLMTSQARNDMPASNRGFACDWDCSLLSEGYHTLRATVCDSLGRCAIDTVVVYIEPTPPIPRIVSPDNQSEVCAEVDILMSCRDENLDRVALYRTSADTAYSAGLVALSQSDYGDANGRPGDGNRAADGEYGDYYSGPVAAAEAILLWVRRSGIPLTSSDPAHTDTDALVEHLARRFGTRANRGTSAEALYRGLLDFCAENGGGLCSVNRFRPDYLTIRTCVQQQQAAVLLALGSAPAVWVAVDGFDGLRRPDGTYPVSVCNPLTGSIDVVPLRPGGLKSEIYLNDSWHAVEMLVALSVKDWPGERQLVGIDDDPADGWSIHWTLSTEQQKMAHFLCAVGSDDIGITGESTILLTHDCSDFHDAGDYNRDGSADIIDLAFLIDFVNKSGPAPDGGAWRADANGDNHVNITDVVYYINYLYGSAASPRH